MKHAKIASDLLQAWVNCESRTIENPLRTILSRADINFCVLGAPCVQSVQCICICSEAENGYLKKKKKKWREKKKEEKIEKGSIGQWVSARFLIHFLGVLTLACIPVSQFCFSLRFVFDHWGGMWWRGGGGVIYFCIRCTPMRGRVSLLPSPLGVYGGLQSYKILRLTWVLRLTCAFDLDITFDLRV